MKNARGALSLLLVLAMLIVGLAALLPVSALADPLEIDDFGVQSSADFAIGGEDTYLWFVFSVGSLDYTEVGFVFSFEKHGNNKTPTVGGSGCYKVAAQHAYRAICADGKTTDAPDGRWWVAVKLTDIPFASYYEWIYVRAFVTDGAGTRYSEVEKLNALKANRGSGEAIHEAIGTSSTGSSAVIEYKQNIYSQVLNNGEKTFCPTAGNPEGNDLLLEYSVFFNEYLVKYIKNNNSPYVTARIAKENYSENSPLSWWVPCDNCSSDCYCAYAGGFETASDMKTPVSDVEVTTPAGMASEGGAYADYPNIGGSDPDNPRYGWHRIGFRVHEEVTKLPTANTEAEYRLTVTTYLDGAPVAKLQGSLNNDKTANYLYTASYNSNTGKVEYTDIGSDRYIFIYRMKYQGNNTGNDKSAYCVFADVYATCGKEFVQQVEQVYPVADGPDDGGYRAENEKGISGPRYYRIVTDLRYPNSFTVMSYNVEVYDKDHGKGWNGRTEGKALDTVLDQYPDVVGFQEVNDKWDPFLEATAKAGEYTRLTGEYTKKYSFEKNEIFFKTSKFRLITEGTKNYRDTASELHVSNTEDADQSLDKVYRIFHYAVLEQKATGKRFLIVNTHLHYGKTGNDAEEHDKLRNYEIRTLLAWLETKEGIFPDDVIVTGDMNAHYKGGAGKTTMEIYTEDGGFAITAKSAKVKGDVGGTLAEQSYTTRPAWVFDYVLTRGDLKAAYYTVVDNPIDTDGRYPSDHVPVIAQIYFTN